MTLGAPAALWALGTIPVLVALYLLRVRRREHPVSSILLWQRSAPTLAAYRPSRRIERSLLLVLQIVIAAALAASLARPSVVGGTLAADDAVLVLDGSLSMRARDVPPTRFDEARAEALQTLRRVPPGQRVGVVLAAARPLVLAPLDADHDRTARALREAEPWDAAADLGAAVDLARSLRPGGRPGIVVWTDAARGTGPALPGVTYRIVGRSGEHVGITAFRLLRDARGAWALVRVENFGRAPANVPLEVTRDGGGRIFATRLLVPGGESRSTAFPVSGAGVLRARVDVHDVLPEDGTAVAVLGAASLPSVLLVGAGDPPLERLLSVLPVARAAVTRATDPAAWRGFDVVVLDRVETGPLPPGRYLLIGTVPPGLPVASAGAAAGSEIAAWDRTDPVLRFVDLDGVHVRRALELSASGGRVLASGPGPLLWAYEGRGVRAVLLAFALDDSDLPKHVAFPVLVANALAWLGSAAGDAVVGDALQISSGGASQAVLTAPDGRRTAIRAEGGTFVLPAFVRAGLYRLAAPSGERLFAVGVGGERAGLIRPGRAPAEPPGPPAAGSAAAFPEPGGGPSGSPAPLLARVPLWPWLLLAAVAAGTGEWILATRRRGGEA